MNWRLLSTRANFFYDFSYVSNFEPFVAFSSQTEGTMTDSPATNHEREGPHNASSSPLATSSSNKVYFSYFEIKRQPHEDGELSDGDDNDK